MVLKDGRWASENVPLRNAMNEILRDDYKEDNERVVDKLEQGARRERREHVPLQGAVSSASTARWACTRACTSPDGTPALAAQWEARSTTELICRPKTDRAYLAEHAECR
jgi:hypothetical protein